MTTIDPASALKSLPALESANLSRTLISPHGNPQATSVAQNFESVFASMLLKEMRQSLEPDSLFGKDSGDIYGGMFDQFMGEELTKGKGLGMAPMIREGIERQERAASHSHAPASLAPASHAPASNAPVSHATPKIAG